MGHYTLMEGSDYEFHIQSRYGLSAQRYNQILRSQDFRCACCGSDKAGGKTQMFLPDHCHESGKVRGLLCHRCNVGIGHLGDNISGLLKAIAYLSKHEWSDGGVLALARMLCLEADRKQQGPIKVHVVSYGEERFLMLRYVDPSTGRTRCRSSKTKSREEAEIAAMRLQAQLNRQHSL